MLVLFAGAAFAQTFTASIVGTVTDPTGAAVAGAKVQLKNVDTQDLRDGMSGASGAYSFQNLLPGNYAITATATGFKNYTRSGLVLRANVSATVDLSMQLGSVQEQVVVSTSTVLVDTESPNNSVTIDSILMANLPNSTRNPLNFVFNLAGTTEAQGGMTSRSQTFDQNASAFGINGGRSAEAAILIDGAPSTAVDWGGLMVAPIQDSVQEQQVIQNQYDVQYNQGGEGIVSIITKNGGNDFHAQVYDYMRNSGLDANTWSNKNIDPAWGQIAERPKFHRNQFGINVSGPIWRSRHLYFFGAYEGLRQPGSWGRQWYTVPTDLEKQGDFSQSYLASGAPVMLFNPFSTRLVDDGQGNTYYTRDPVPGNDLKNLGVQLDPVGQKLAALYPSPNLPGEGPNHIRNFTAIVSDNTINDKFDWRVDWAQNEKHRIFARMSDRVREGDTPGCAFCTGADNISGNQDHGFQIVVSDTLTPSPTWVINTYGAYSRWFEGQTAIGEGVADITDIGLPASFSQANLLPQVYTTGYDQLGSSYSSYQRYVRTLVTGIVNVT
ncbi:MAG: carboxypeptidase-like regulatory domain-containing protein, partial [Acidobacteriaceae bacterium]|nr:carboxypeptidase-like regulatory domain-containing protein [Acidobacteriaceae bacterium]